MWETQVRSLGQEVPLEKEMATHSSTLAWRNPWREEPGGLQSMGLQKVGHDWVISMYSCHLFVISSASVGSIPFLPFIVLIFAWNFPLVSLVFLKSSLVFPILLFSSISLHWLLRKAFLSLLVILWNSAFKWVHLLFSPLPLASLLFSAICKASSHNHFAFLHFFFLGMILIPASCTMSQTSVHHSSGTLSLRSNPLNYLSFPLYNQKGFDLGHTWMI